MHPGNFFRGIAGNGGEIPVPAQESPALVIKVKDAGHALDQRIREQPLRLCNRFRSFAFGDVAHNRRGADNFRRACNRAVGTPDGRNGDGDGKRLAVPAHAHGFKVPDTFALSDAGQDPRFLSCAILRDKHSDGPADDFRCRVAEQSFRGGIPVGDDALQGLGGDGVLRGLHDGCKPFDDGFRAPALFFAREIIQRKRHVDGGLDEQRNFLVLEKSRFGRVDRERAANLASQSDRKHGGRAESAKFRLRAPRQRSWIAGKVVADIRLALAKCRARRALTLGPIVGVERDPLKIAAIVARLRHRDQPVAHWLVPSDPGHANSAMLDQGVANLLEQLVARRHPDDGLIDLAECGIKPPEPFVLRLLLLALADVPCRHERGRLCFKFERYGRDLDVYRGPIGPDVDLFAQRQRLIDVKVMNASLGDRSPARMDDRQGGLADERGRVSHPHQPRHGMVDEDDFSVLVHDHRIGRLVDYLAQAPFAVAQCPGHVPGDSFGAQFCRGQQPDYAKQQKADCNTGHGHARRLAG